MIENTEFTSNSAGDEGGAIYVESFFGNNFLTLEECTLRDNFAA